MLLFLMQVAIEWPSILTPLQVPTGFVSAVNQATIQEMFNYWLTHLDQFPNAVIERFGIVRYFIER